MSAWYIRRGEKVFGPVDLPKIRELARQERLHGTDELATNVEGPWQQASVLGFVPEQQQHVEQPDELQQARDVLAKRQAEIVQSKKVQNPPTHGSDTRPCPYCGETILAVAKKCRFCGEFLTGGRLSHATEVQQRPVRVLTSEDSVLTRNRGCADLLLLFIGVPIVLFLVIMLFSSFRGC